MYTTEEELKSWGKAQSARILQFAKEHGVLISDHSRFELERNGYWAPFSLRDQRIGVQFLDRSSGIPFAIQFHPDDSASVVSVNWLVQTSCRIVMEKWKRWTT